MKGFEVRVVDALQLWLEGECWVVTREVQFCDVMATRGPEVIYAEAKGRTAALGLDVDTMYGQLLRRMPAEKVDLVRYAVVVPAEARAAALRVPPRVRQLLGIDVYTVDPAGWVSRE
jgi:hypothetical protein